MIPTTTKPAAANPHKQNEAVKALVTTVRTAIQAVGCEKWAELLGARQ